MLRERSVATEEEAGGWRTEFRMLNFQWQKAIWGLKMSDVVTRRAIANCRLSSKRDSSTGTRNQFTWGNGRLTGVAPNPITAAWLVIDGWTVPDRSPPTRTWMKLDSAGQRTSTDSKTRLRPYHFIVYQRQEDGHSWSVLLTGTCPCTCTCARSFKRCCFRLLLGFRQFSCSSPPRVLSHGWFFDIVISTIHLGSSSVGPWKQWIFRLCL